MSYKLNNLEKLFLTFSVLNTAVVCFWGVNYLIYGLYAYLLVLRCTKKIKNDNFLLFALFIPNKYLQLLALPIYIFLSPSLRKKQLNNSEKAFLAYILIVGVANCVFYENILIGTLFQVGVYYCVFKVVAFFGLSVDKLRTLSILDKLLPVQLLSCAIQFIHYRAIGDPITGTLISAHYLGVYLIIYIILIIRIRPFKYKSKDFWMRIIAATFALYMSDAKHVWAVFIFAFIVAWLLSKLKIKRAISVPIIIMTVLVIVGTIFFTDSTSYFANRFNLAKIYVLNEQYNKKVVFFRRTFNEMFGLNGIFGFGVGQFGSQISLTLSKGIIYSWDPSLSAYHFAIEPYANAIEGLMTEWYTKYGIGISSMVLGYPLVSFIGLFAELGVVGYLWLLHIFDKRFKHENPTFIIAFFLLTIFDTYFEIPCVLIMILIATYGNPTKRSRLNQSTISSSFLQKGK